MARVSHCHVQRLVLGCTAEVVCAADAVDFVGDTFVSLKTSDAGLGGSVGLLELWDSVKFSNLATAGDESDSRRCCCCARWPVLTRVKVAAVQGKGGSARMDRKSVVSAKEREKKIPTLYLPRSRSRSSLCAFDPDGVIAADCLI